MWQIAVLTLVDGCVSRKRHWISISSLSSSLSLNHLMHVTYIKVGTVQLVGLKWRTLIKLLQYIQTGLLLELEINQSLPVVKSYVCVTYYIVRIDYLNVVD